MFGQILGALAGGLLGGGDSESSTTSKREPWAPAQDWLKGNIALGQQLQNQYMDNPFSDQQKAAYSNAFGMSDAYRAMLPQLLSGLNMGQFDRTNPLKRPQAMGFGGFNPQMSQVGAFRPTNLVQQARTAVPTPVALPAAQSAHDGGGGSSYSEYGFGGFGGLDGFGDGGTWA